VIEIWNWLVQSSLISAFMSGVLLPAFCQLHSTSCYSWSVSRAICFPRCPGRSSRCPSADFTQLYGKSNTLSRSLMEIGMLGWHSATSVTCTTCCHRNLIVWKVAPFRRTLQTDFVAQNSVRHGKKIWNGIATAAAVPSDIIVS
jgi:hypothetical protein